MSLLQCITVTRSLRKLFSRCAGRDSVPDNKSVEKFIKKVTQFSSQHAHSNKYVPVHCTHGQNRTGYMIFHYLIRSESVSLTEAINRFSKPRPLGIYKQVILTIYAIFSMKNCLEPFFVHKPQNGRDHLIGMMM